MIKKIVLKEMGLLSKKENPKSLPVKGSDVCDFFALFAQRGGTKNKRLPTRYYLSVEMYMYYHLSKFVYMKLLYDIFIRYFGMKILFTFLTEKKPCF